MSQYCVIGRHGLIGSAIAARIDSSFGEFPPTSFPTKETRIIFDFGSYRHPDFEQNEEWLLDQQLQQFSRTLRYCAERDILFVYPSSALVYEKETRFANLKLTLESMAKCYKARTLGLRIFPVYGPGESATVISQWCSYMRDGHQPVVYGDGTQTRDFIYIDDVVDQIFTLLEACKYSSGVFDVGTGQSTSFNAIVNMINKALGTSIQPRYVARPSSYSEGIYSKTALSHKVSVEQGIQKILSTHAKTLSCCGHPSALEPISPDYNSWGVAYPFGKKACTPTQCNGEDAYQAGHPQIDTAHVL